MHKIAKVGSLNFIQTILSLNKNKIKLKRKKRYQFGLRIGRKKKLLLFSLRAF